MLYIASILTISSYFTKLKTLWGELKEFRPVPVCSCGGMKKLMEFQQQEYVFQFLMGLNESYGQICAQILMIDLLPPINKIFSFVIQEGRQRSLSYFSPSNESNTDVFGVSSSNYNSYKGRCDKLLCTNCGFHWHTVEKCYMVHGFHLGFKFKPRNTDA